MSHCGFVHSTVGGCGITALEHSSQIHKKDTHPLTFQLSVSHGLFFLIFYSFCMFQHLKKFAGQEETTPRLSCS